MATLHFRGGFYLLSSARSALTFRSIKYLALESETSEMPLVLEVEPRLACWADNESFWLNGRQNCMSGIWPDDGKAVDDIDCVNSLNFDWKSSNIAGNDTANGYSHE